MLWLVVASEAPMAPPFVERPRTSLIVDRDLSAGHIVYNNDGGRVSNHQLKTGVCIDSTSRLRS